MEDLRDAIRRELKLDDDAGPKSELASIQALHTDLLWVVKRSLLSHKPERFGSARARRSMQVVLGRVREYAPALRHR